VVGVVALACALVALLVTAVLRDGPPAERPSGQAGPCGYPAQVLGLRDWKLTLPTRTGHGPTEVGPSELAKYVNPPWFTPTADCRGVVLRAPVNGATTSGSDYPRSELREMGPDGGRASWSSTSGTHALVVVTAFTALPAGRPFVVGAQIHGSDDDVTVFRLEGTRLYVTKGDDEHYELADADYVLGTPFQARYVVADGEVQAFYNGRLVATIDEKFSQAYFKVGAYTQANCDNAAPCEDGNAGETTVYQVSVSHRASD
jgi:hypothetical protein